MNKTTSKPPTKKHDEKSQSDKQLMFFVQQFALRKRNELQKIRSNHINPREREFPNKGSKLNGKKKKKKKKKTVPEAVAML